MAAPSSSYSALLRRSKLAAFTPQVDQVYTTSQANLARSNFGLKRPLPQATTKTSPFVRLTQLDSNEGRTVFRKATREAKLVKQWQETGVGIQSEAFVPRSTASRRWDRLELQSRFVEGTGPGAVKGVDAHRSAQTTIHRLPNVFALGEGEFDRFLEELGDRRAEFKAFVVAETNKANQAATPLSVDEFDLYDHAQRNPTELIRLVERFLRTSPPSSSASLSSAPLPQIHPTLALQYASPTPLESALAPPIRGRLLGPSPDSANRSSGGPWRAARNDQYASVLSTVAVVPGSATGGQPSTTFFPDATGVRSNEPGRASFRLNPTINPTQHAVRTSVQGSSGLGRQSYDFRPPTAEYEPSTLALKALDLRPSVVTPHNEPGPLPGSPAYSGNVPADLRSSRARGAGGKDRLSFGSGSLADLWDPSTLGGRSPRQLGLGSKNEPQDLVAARKNRRTKEQHEAFVRRSEGFRAAGGADKVFGGAGARRQGQQGKQQRNQGKKGDKSRDLLAKLDALLDPK
ncbi:hypothetical protein JCM8097_005516 [Rhodosporidiobolus ruineniae]